MTTIERIGRRIARAALLAAVWALMATLIAHAVGWAHGHPQAFGGWRVTPDVVVYAPWRMWAWRDVVGLGNRWYVDSGILLVAGLAGLCAWRAVRRAPRTTTFGQARWARRTDVAAAGLLDGGPANENLRWKRYVPPWR